MQKTHLVVILLFFCIIILSRSSEARSHKSHHGDILINKHDKQDYFKDSIDTNREKKCRLETALRSRRRNPFNRIAGGRDAREGEFPSFVSLAMGPSPNLTQFDCSGVAISKTLILTAAHCFSYEIDGYKVWAVPGIYPPSEWRNHKVKAYEVVQLCPSPEFEELDYGATLHDYQILRVSKPMAGIKPAKLNGAELPIGFKAMSVGAGFIDRTEDKLIVAKRLQVLPVMHLECLDDEIHHTHICFRSYKSNLVGGK